MRSILLLMILFLSASSYAEHDPEVMHSMKCVSLFQKNEYEYNIPLDALYSISLQESGRKHSKKGSLMPWPWTVNVEGKGYHFDSKQEAVSFVKKELVQGRFSIDVGCMQVNLKHHPDAFRTVEEAFDPKANIAYGASFLRSKYEQLGSWHKAIAHYHSATPELGNNYKNRVIKIAQNIDKYKNAMKLGHSKYNEVSSSKVARSSRRGGNFASKSKRYKSDMMVYVPRA